MPLPKPPPRTHSHHPTNQPHTPHPTTPTPRRAHTPNSHAPRPHHRPTAARQPSRATTTTPTLRRHLQLHLRNLQQRQSPTRQHRHQANAPTLATTQSSLTRTNLSPTTPRALAQRTNQGPHATKPRHQPHNKRQGGQNITNTLPPSRDRPSRYPLIFGFRPKVISSHNANNDYAKGIWGGS